MSNQISIKDAEKIVLDEYEDYRITSVVDFNDLYVFSTIPMDYEEESNNPFIRGLLAVNKNTGKLTGFNPLVNNPNEYFKAAKNAIRYE